MCVYSMVHDHYLPRFPSPVPADNPWTPNPNPWIQPTKTVPVQPILPNPVDWSKLFKKDPTPDPEVEELKAKLRVLIDEYREALTAAKKVDELTHQPDCPSPEKLKLEERVAELEKRFLAPAKKRRKKTSKKAKKLTKAQLAAAKTKKYRNSFVSNFPE